MSCKLCYHNRQTNTAFDASGLDALMGNRISSFFNVLLGGPISHQHNAQHRDRSCQTSADLYFSKHGKLPFPQQMHKILANPTSGHAQSDALTKRVLVIGDIHGCATELRLLVDKAKAEANNGEEFAAVICVGDLVNKGPHSIAVLREFQKHAHYHSVRGNHDDGALEAALGDSARQNKEKYRWIREGEHPEEEKTKCTAQDMTINAVQQGDQPDSEEEKPLHRLTLSDSDITFLSELPYTISIPWILDTKENVLIVHAGLIPGVPVSDQTIETMITLREVCLIPPSPSTNPARENKGDGTIKETRGQKLEPGSTGGSDGDQVYVDARKCDMTTDSMGADASKLQHIPWASVWKGPDKVIFGHDAPRELQRYEGDFAIGLDTGACYGKKLTGIVLPQFQLVSVDSLRQYSAIGGN